MEKINSDRFLKGIVILLSVWSFNATAQTVQFVTLTASNNVAVSFPVQTNQIISLVGYDWSDNGQFQVSGGLANGSGINLGINSRTFNGAVSTSQMATGLTNILLSNTGSLNPTVWVTFQITTPACANVVSNYVPADAIVIPSSATGNVQIILESSADLVNWTAANPGTYGASSATNRFFRVRAVHN